MVSSRNVPPGGEGTIEVTFNTKNKSGKTRKRITVHTNDPSNRRLQLYVMADLEELLASSPKRLWFDRISDLKPISRTFSLDGTRLDTVVIKNIRIKSSVPEGTYTWKLNDGRPRGLRSVTLDITLHPDRIIPGKFNHTLVVETDLEVSSNIEIRLSGEVLGPLSFDPARVLFGNYQTGEVLEETVVIRANTGKAFLITEIESLDSEIQVKQKNNFEALAHTLIIRLDSKEDRERIQTRIRITTNLDNQSEMYLDVHGFRKRQPKQITPRAVY
ncbi:DUF1573 domain-containing protein [bacterium]|nr:DUF1573 domain-containing protein [bacterium]